VAHLWKRVALDAGGEPAAAGAVWAVAPLEAAGAAFGEPPGSPLFLPCPDAAAEFWVLVGPPDVTVNGLPLLAGLRVLRDRDEVCAGGHQVFFSTERLARVEPFPGAAQPIYCARCKDVIERGADAVRCPDCGLWCHQTADTPCWTYGETCALCPQPTDLDASYRWTPEEL
jgi:hypothetical protein